jgi:hypothetical protein
MRLGRPKGPIDRLSHHYSRTDLEIGFISTIGKPAWVEPWLHLSFLRGVLIQVNEGTVVPQYHEFSDAAAAADNRGNEELFRS